MVDDRHSGSDAGAALPDEFAPDPRNVRLLKWAIYIMSALLVIGVIVVGVTIAKRAGNLSAGARAGFGELDVAIPAGASVSRIAIDADRMAIHVKPSDGSEEIVIVNIRRGRIEGRVKLTPQP